MPEHEKEGHPDRGPLPQGEAVKEQTISRKDAKTRKELFFVFFAASTNFVPPRGMKCFCSSRDCFTASETGGNSKAHAGSGPGSRFCAAELELARLYILGRTA